MIHCDWSTAQNDKNSILFLPQKAHLSSSVQLNIFEDPNTFSACLAVSVFLLSIQLGHGVQAVLVDSPK